MRDQRRDRGHLPRRAGDVQRRVAGLGKTRIGALLEEKHRDVLVASGRQPPEALFDAAGERHEERRHPIGGCLVDIGPRRHQQTNGLQIARHRRVEERCQPALGPPRVTVPILFQLTDNQCLILAQALGLILLRSGILSASLRDDRLAARAQVGPGLDEDTGHRGMSLGGREDQRREPARRRRGHIGAPGEQRPDDIDVTGTRREQQRCFAVRPREIRIGPRLEQRLHHRGATVRAGQHERCHTEVVRGVRVGTGLNQPPRRRHVVPMRRPRQRRGTICPGDVHVDPFIQQHARSRGVLPLHRLD